MGQEAKEYLARARRLQSRLDALERAKSCAWERATSVTPNSGMTVQGGDISRKTESYAVLTEKIEAERERLMRLKAEIIETVNQVEDNTLCALLTEFYINGATWEQTSVRINYSYYHTVHVLHPKALQAIDRIIHLNPQEKK